MTSTTSNPSVSWGMKSDAAHAAGASAAMSSGAAVASATNTNIGANGSHTSPASQARSIQGATAEGPAVPIDSLTLAVQSINLPPCPEDYARFIEDTSLERLVYWKLQGLFEKFDEEPPKNIGKTVLAHVERPLFALVLRKTKGNQSKAAEVLGCNRNTLHRKLKGFAIAPRDLRRALKNRDRKSVVDALDEMVQQD